MPNALACVVRVTVRPVTGRFRAAIAAGLLIVAVGTSACSLSSSSQGKSLPVSVSPIDPSVHNTKCTLNSSGTQVVATGTFNPAASLPVNAYGQQEGSLELQLRVLTSQTRFGVHLDVGESVAGVSVGETSWHVVATVQRAPGLRPSRCVVDLASQA
jgi:hypothetical protein